MHREAGLLSIFKNSHSCLTRKGEEWQTQGQLDLQVSGLPEFGSEHL